MKIVADKDIPGVQSAFAPFGDLVLKPGREISAEDVRHADALLVRTVTRITPALVQGSALRFVGSATSGTDHVDVACLAASGVSFSHAPGCNADAVVNYVIAVLAWLAERDGFDWRTLSAGIIGAGNVGGRLARVLTRLGMKVAIHDPFLDASHPLAAAFTTLDQVLASDLVSLHVPLTTGGEFPTHHLLNADRLALLNSNAILINAARGEVVDNKALLESLTARPDLRVVLDTWENEPVINHALADRVAMGTPHIAGYSAQGKRNGTAAVLRGFCACFGLDETDSGLSGAREELPLASAAHDAGLFNRAILQAYPIHKDCLDGDSAGEFETRRNNYAYRKEFAEFAIASATVAPAQAAALAALGFVIT